MTVASPSPCQSYSAPVTLAPTQIDFPLSSCSCSCHSLHIEIWPPYSNFLWSSLSKLFVNFIKVVLGIFYIKFSITSWQCDHSWRFMTIYDDTWGYMQIHEDSWLLTVHDNFWQFIMIYENSLQFVINPGETLQFMTIHKYHDNLWRFNYWQFMTNHDI